MKYVLVALAIFVVIVFGWLIIQSGDGDGMGTELANTTLDLPSGLSNNFSTDFSNSSLDDFSELIQGVGGVSDPKDVIPALSDPAFVAARDSDVAEDVRGLFIELDGESKFYPYFIMVWHEIVNDTVGDTPVVVTFCPLCGTGIAYDARVDGEVLEFGVSGFLRESNMVMYDRQTESLWQQTTGLSFVGDNNTKQLEHISVQLLDFATVKQLSPNVLVLSEDTGHSRDYKSGPYGDYDTDNDYFIFRPSKTDERYPAKELFYIIPLNNDSIALRFQSLYDQVELTLDDGTELIAKKSDGLVNVTADGEEIPGYFEMWFSWIVWHDEDGIVWDPS